MKPMNGILADIVVASGGTVTAMTRNGLIANWLDAVSVIAPQITTQPTSQTIDECSTATFTVTATGTAPLTYTWRKNGVIVGTNSASYSLITAATDNAAVITCTVSNSAGSAVSSNAVLTIQRNFVTFDPVLQTHMTMQTPKTFAGDFEFKVELALTAGGGNIILGSGTSTRPAITVESGVVYFKTANSTLSSGLEYNDGKLHQVIARRVGTTLTLILDGVQKASASEVVSTFKLDGVGYYSNGLYFNGVIANVTLTDLSNPSNSESWKLDRPIGTNTEQSSSGNNLLTYVNATKRELFTKVGNDWLSHNENIGLFSTSSGLSTRVDDTVRILTTAAGEYTIINYAAILPTTYLVTCDALVAEGMLGITTSSGGGLSTPDISTSGRTSRVLNLQSGMGFKRLNGGINDITLTNVSVKRILEVA